ncbi:MAG: DUF2231 domain-containing protein [Bacteroidetes bacterium]|nr:DUF2231 domain-containing protein [Bacteroidota bacterium]
MFDLSHSHPMVVHFPIVIIMVGFLADLASLLFSKEKCLSKMGFYLEMLGVLAAIVAFGTGYFLTSSMEGEAGALRERHELFATCTLVTIIIAALFRILLVYLGKEETRLKYAAMGIFFLAFLFVGITGYLGGSLVYEYMVGL